MTTAQLIADAKRNGNFDWNADDEAAADEALAIGRKARMLGGNGASGKGRRACKESRTNALPVGGSGSERPATMRFQRVA